MIGLLNRITSFFIGFGYLFLSLDTSFLALVFVLPPDAAIRPPSETLFASHPSNRPPAPDPLLLLGGSCVVICAAKLE